jgi:type IV secretion system protein VirD4
MMPYCHRAHGIRTYSARPRFSIRFRASADRPGPAALARTPPGPEQPPALLLLDEFAALGRLEPVLQAAGLMAGLGLQLWPILQDLAQLLAACGPSASTFLANAGLIQISAPADLETAQWLSTALGSTTVAYETISQSISTLGLLATLHDAHASTGGQQQPPRRPAPAHPRRGHAPATAPPGAAAAGATPGAHRQVALLR